METRAFALKVLFSSSLEEKLQPGGPLTDEEPGAALGTPGEPGRPVDLRLRADGVRAEFPGDANLVNEEQRGILLHFFANHELLATELMALVLLKFPDAPREFRRGIVRTLEEEQQHTTWYLRRMEQCGVTFGDFPVNRFFWDSIAPMETPLDYVTRLSLTFEQANLDYARHYSALMQQAGDEKGIPEKILPLLRAADYCGPVGIDAFVFRTPDGQLHLRPIVEMNPRFTMGRLTWELMRRVAHGRTIRFELIRSNSPAESIRDLEAAHPPQLSKEGKLISGCVVLNEPDSVLAVLRVGQESLKHEIWCT